jgi:sugar phosphate isomerase/epimerase
MSPQIGVQLYSVRDALAQDFYGTMKRIAEIGFAGVETAFFSDNITPREAKRAFEALGLTVIAAHCPLPVGETQAFTLSLLDGLDCQRAVWHGWPEDERYRTEEGLHTLAAQYNEANGICRANGRTLGLHNHWWEFQTVGDSTAFAQLRPLLEPDIFFELDTYWIQTAGHDPAEVVRDYGVRAPLLHLKDGPATISDDMVPIGSGSIDTPAIVRAAQSSAEWLIVELDTVSGEIFDALSQSYRFLAR